MSEKTEVVEVSSDISNNIGELFKEAKTRTIQGTQVAQREEQLTALRAILKEFKGESLSEARYQFQRILELLFKGKKLDEELILLQKRDDPQKILASAWNMYLSREDHLQKLKESLED